MSKQAITDGKLQVKPGSWFHNIYLAILPLSIHSYYIGPSLYVYEIQSFFRKTLKLAFSHLAPSPNAKDMTKALILKDLSLQKYPDNNLG